MVKERTETLAEIALVREFPKSCDLKNALSLTFEMCYSSHLNFLTESLLDGQHNKEKKGEVGKENP